MGMALPDEYQLETPQPRSTAVAPDETAVQRPAVDVPATDIGEVLDGVRQVQYVERELLQRNVGVLEEHLEEHGRVHDDVLSEMQAAIHDAERHLDGLSGYYDGEESARDRLTALRREKWAAVREYYRQKHDIEQELAAVMNELERERRVQDAALDVLDG
jgi:hypothetical protein